jgi:hypothetical protein
MAETKGEARTAFDAFMQTYQVQMLKALENESDI